MDTLHHQNISVWSLVVLKCMCTSLGGPWTVGIDKEIKRADLASDNWVSCGAQPKISVLPLPDTPFLFFFFFFFDWFLWQAFLGIKVHMIYYLRLSGTCLAVTLNLFTKFSVFSDRGCTTCSTVSSLSGKKDSLSLSLSLSLSMSNASTFYKYVPSPREH